MDKIEFSVSMCVYGKDDPEHFRIAADSILNQSAPPTEVVLVVDGPVPEALDRIIADYERRPVFRVIRLETNQGHGNARRVGLENCRCKLVALMDADDISMPQRFEKQLACFRNDSELTVVGSSITEFIGTTERVTGRRVVPEQDAEIKAYMKARCPMNQVTVMFRLADVMSAGGYIDWYCEEDYYLWLRLALAGKKFHNIQEDLVFVRVGEEMYRRRGGWKYFKSEARLQGFMLGEKIIGLPTYLTNVAKRLVVQVLLPNRLRGWVFQRFARQ